MTTWTNPSHVTTLTTISSTAHNAQVIDNLSYLFTRPLVALNYLPGSNKTNTGLGSAWAQVDSVNAAVTLAINNGRVFGYWSFWAFADNNAHTMEQAYGTFLDGAQNGPFVAFTNEIYGNSPSLWTVPVVYSGLSVATHTFSLGWFNTGGTGASQIIYSTPSAIQLFLWEA